MKERPILFSGPMVRAILAGTKTQTRRVVTPQPEDAHTDGAERQVAAPTCIDLAPGTEFFRWLERAGVSEGFTCPYGQPGDRLWVRETVTAHPDYPDALTLPEYEGGHNQERVLYRADAPRKLVRHYGIDFEKPRWKPSIFMPRWACRLVLEVTSVRVERLQDITEEDAKAEGVERFGCGTLSYSHVGCCGYVRPYAVLWDEINGKRAPWASNPWVWVIGFRRADSAASSPTAAELVSLVKKSAPKVAKLDKSLRRTFAAPTGRRG